MILLFTSILFGMLTTMLLCSPASYTWIFISMFLLLPFLIYLFRKVVAQYSKIYYVLSILAAFISYSCTSYAIFHTPRAHYHELTKSNEARIAILFVAPGEMEHYSLSSAASYLKNKSSLQKPYYCAKLKSNLPATDSNTSLLKLSNQLRTILMNYCSCLYYDVLLHKGQSLAAMINQAAADGCGTVYVLNYSTIASRELLPDSQSKFQTKVMLSPPLLYSDAFLNGLAVYIVSKSDPKDSIWIMDQQCDASLKLKHLLAASGYSSEKIMISPVLTSSAVSDYVRKNNIEHLVFVNLAQGYNLTDSFFYQNKLNSVKSVLEPGVRTTVISVNADRQEYVSTLIHAFIEIKNNGNIDSRQAK